MRAPARLTSRLAPVIERYVSLKNVLGRQYAAERWKLGHVDRFLAAHDADLTADTFAEWCLTLQQLATGTRRRRMLVVRNLCLYRRRQEPTCFVPDERLFPPTHQVMRPYLFTDDDVLRLLTTASALQPSLTSPLRSENLRLAIVLLYTDGTPAWRVGSAHRERLRRRSAHVADSRIEVSQIARGPALTGRQP
jgi:integrase/recombinase XerD